jgi:hypothetical protein
MKNLFLCATITLLGFANIAYSSDFTKKPISAGTIEFNSKMSGDTLIEAAKKLKKSDPNFKYMAVNQCGPNEYCVQFLYNNTGDGNKKLLSTVDTWSKEFAKEIKGRSIGPAEVLCQNDCAQ